MSTLKVSVRDLYFDEDLGWFEAFTGEPITIDSIGTLAESIIWTVTLPNGSQAADPIERSTKYLFLPDVPGRYTLTMTATSSGFCTLPEHGNQVDCENAGATWVAGTDSETFEFLVKTRAPHHQKLVDVSFIQEALPSVWSLVDNKRVLHSVWSSLAQIISNDLMRIIEVDASKAIKYIPTHIQRKWLQYNPFFNGFENEYILLVQEISGDSTIAEASRLLPITNGTGFGQLSQTKKETFTVKSRNTLSISPVPRNLLNSVFKVHSGAHTGSSFKITGLGEESVRIIPQFPRSSIGRSFRAVSKNPIKSSGLLAVCTDSGGTEHVRTVLGYTDGTLTLDSSVPAETYTVSIRSIVSGTSSMEDAGISKGDRLVVQVSDVSGTSYNVPLEITAVKGNTASFSEEGLTEAEKYLFFREMGYTGAYFESDTIKFVFQERYDKDLDRMVTVFSKAETLFNFLGTYPTEFLGFKIYPTTNLHSTLISGRLKPLFIIRNTKIPINEDVTYLPELRDYITPLREFFDTEEGVHKVESLLGNLFLKYKEKSQMFYGKDYTVSDGFLNLSGFTFTDPAPKYLWAPLTLLDNNDTIEDNFGKAGGLTKEEYLALSTGLPYREVLQGLMYSYMAGSTQESLEIGLHLLLDIPIVLDESQVSILAEKIGDQFRYETIILESGRVRNILIPARDYIHPLFSTIAQNRETGEDIKENDVVPAFTPLSSFIRIEDDVRDSTKPNHIHTWEVLVDANVVDSSLIPKSREYIEEIKPVYTDLSFVFILFLVDIITVTDSNDFEVDLLLLDTPSHETAQALDSSNSSGDILRRLDSQDFTTQTYFLGHNMTLTESGTITAEVSPVEQARFLAGSGSTIDVVVGPSVYTIPINDGGIDPVQVGDILHIHRGPNQGYYQIDSVDNHYTLTVSRLAGEEYPNYIDSSVSNTYTILRLTVSPDDSDDEYERLSPGDVLTSELDFGVNTVSGGSGTVTQDAIAVASYFEAIGVLAGDFLVVNGTEYEILSVSGNSVTIAENDTFTTDIYYIRRYANA